MHRFSQCWLSFPWALGAFQTQVQDFCNVRMKESKTIQTMLLYFEEQIFQSFDRLSQWFWCHHVFCLINLTELRIQKNLECSLNLQIKFCVFSWQLFRFQQDRILPMQFLWFFCRWIQRSLRFCHFSKTSMLGLKEFACL